MIWAVFICGCTVQQHIRDNAVTLQFCLLSYCYEKPKQEPGKPDDQPKEGDRR